MKLGNAVSLLGAGALFVNVVGATVAHSADLTAREVTIKLFEADAANPVDFSDLNLTLIDISGLDFKKATFEGADLYGTDLSGSDLSGTDLKYTRLDRSSIIGTNFSKADLTEATLLRPTTFTNVKFDRSEVANFSGATLVRTRFFARLDGANFRSANLTEADFSPLESGANTISTVPHNQLSGVDFTGAKMHKVNLQQGVLDFAIFTNADLRDADLRSADLRGADFTGANLAGANLTGANLAGTRLSGAKGLSSAKGLDVAGNPAANRDELKRP
ncbi:MAG: pentapeptide repeat-containing protein [Alphaproteobacteria bacterium]|nr:pentapeptide repeat-containing protein [Alphaproteobacteria bacterium]